MSTYSPPLRDIRFVLDHICDFDGLSQLEAFSHADRDAVLAILEEYGRFMSNEVAPTNVLGDHEMSVWHDGGVVTTPASFKPAYRQYVDAGWGAVPFEPAYGGGGFPWVVGIAMQEMLNSSNMAFGMLPLLTQGAIDLLLAHGSEEQKATYAEKMITGEWSGTMNLTEPEAGSDVGSLTARALPQADGSYRITGTKIFITFGEHDLADNIIHLVLARTPDAPPGTKGISCFIVPKFLVNADGSLGERNDVTCVSIEHKMGIKASPTCVLSYGDNGGATGYLIGEENRGMSYMFTMMNNARLSVGIEGLGLAERSYQQAARYAKERVQGRVIGTDRGARRPIIGHADVRRMLLTMKAYIEAMRALTYFEAAAVDRAKHHPDAAVRERAQEDVDLLTPQAKSWCTDLANEVTSLGIQIYGGMGFIEETGMAQHYRDARITAIYEGTNGIQAMDLIGRKLPLRGGAAFADYLTRIAADADTLAQSDNPDLAVVGSALLEALATVNKATSWLVENGLTNIGDALAGSVAFQRMLSQLSGGWLLGKGALAAATTLAGNSASNAAATDALAGDAEFLQGKISTARFYAEQLLPMVHGLLSPATAGSATIFAVPDELIGA